MTLRIGIIGLGDIAEKAYLPVIGSHPEVELAGIMSRSEATVERIGRRFRVEGRYTALDRMLGEQALDAVFVHSPTESHFSTVTQCLRAGVHVYVDKPLSYDIRESEEMTAYAQESGKLLAVGFNRRFAPLYIEARAWLEEAGGFELCAADKHRTRRQKHSAKHTLYDDLIHMIDLVVWLTGGKEKLADYRQMVDSEGRLGFASGTLASGSRQAAFSMSRSAGLDLERLELHGGGRSAQVVNLERAVFASAADGAREASFGSWDTVSYRRGFTGAVEHFLSCLDAPEACQIAAHRVLPTHRLIEELLQRAAL
jgi:virulence factor